MIHVLETLLTEIDPIPATLQKVHIQNFFQKKEIWMRAATKG